MVSIKYIKSSHIFTFLFCFIPIVALIAGLTRIYSRDDVRKNSSQNVAKTCTRLEDPTDNQIKDFDDFVKVSWKSAMNNTAVNFEISMSLVLGKDRWVALSLSPIKNKEGFMLDAQAYFCSEKVMTAGMLTSKEKPQYKDTPGFIAKTPKYTITEKDGYRVCSFTRMNKIDDGDSDSLKSVESHNDINPSINGTIQKIYLATGPIDKMHDCRAYWPFPELELVDTLDKTQLDDDQEQTKLTHKKPDVTKVQHQNKKKNDKVRSKKSWLQKIHGTIMILSWLLILKTSIYIASFCKAVFPKSVWFKLHRNVNCICVIFGILGLIIGILSSSTPKIPGRGWKWKPHFTKTSSQPVMKAHSFLAFLFFFIVFCNVFIGITGVRNGNLGPASNESPSSAARQTVYLENRRKYWHTILGWGVWVLSDTIIFLGLYYIEKPDAGGAWSAMLNLYIVLLVFNYATITFCKLRGNNLKQEILNMTHDPANGERAFDDALLFATIYVVIVVIISVVIIKKVMQLQNGV